MRDIQETRLPIEPQGAALLRQTYGAHVTRLAQGGLPLCLVLLALRGVGTGRQE